MSPVYKAVVLVDFDGIETTKVVDVSSQMADAQMGIWCFYDLDGSPIEGAAQITGITEVTLNVAPALIAGTYKLVGLA